VDDQVRVAFVPAATEAGFTEIATVGAGGGDEGVDELAPPQLADAIESAAIK
jgi:hypothetical protein